MRAAVLAGTGVVTVREVERPAAVGTALVRVGQAGLCGTDLKIAAGEIPVAAGRILGHEMTGQVEVAGPRGLVPAGARVLVNPAAYCGHCDLCRRDLPQLCRDGALLGRDRDGCFSEFVAVDETCLHPIPAALPAAAEPLLQVLSTCVHAQSSVFRYGGIPSLGLTAVVVGLGVSGLLHVQLLRARGVSTIIGVTRSAWKKDLALWSGASSVAAPDEAAAAVADATGGRGADVVIECAGTADTFAQATRLAGAGGTVVMFGIPGQSAGVGPAYDWYYKELTIKCPRAARPRDCDLAISLCASGRLDVGRLVTARFPVERVADALAACRDPAQLKVVLDIG